MQKLGYTFSMFLFRLGIAGLILLPAVAFGAGFAKQSLFLSRSPAVEGESILVHAIVQNDSTAAFAGEVVFSSQRGSDAKQKIGSAAASIAPQGAQAVSVSWKPLAGEYTVVASLTGKDGAVVEEESGHFTINEKPKPATQDSAADEGVQSSSEVQGAIAKISPTVADFARPAFLAIDGLRTGAVNFLNQGINWSKAKVGAKTPGAVLGEATKKENTSPQGILGTVTYLGAMLALYALSILKWLVANAGIFYPVLAVAFLLGIWKLLSGIRRPRY